MSGQARRFLFSDSSDGSFTASPSNFQTPTAGDGSLLSPFTPTESRLVGTRRKLSMSASPFDALSMSTNENSPLCKNISQDSAYEGSVSSSQKSSMSSWMSLNSTPTQLPAGLTSSDNTGVLRSPLCEIQPSTSGVFIGREHVQKPLVKPAPERLSDKENQLPAAAEGVKFMSPRYRPASLPTLSSPLSQAPDLHSAGACLEHQLSSPQTMGENRAAKTRSLCGQISSPLGRMSLVSPTGRPRSFGTSRPSSTTSISESDGYFSEVFDGEETEEEPPISFAVSSLIHSTNFDPSPMTSRVSEKNEVVRPTPLRPPLGRFEAALQQRRGSLKRASPMTELNDLHQSKRPPLPFISQDSPPSISTPVQGSLLLRSQSCCMPPVQSKVSPLNPGSGRKEDYIGDNTKPFALPLVEGSIRDLKCISVDTLGDLLNGKYNDVVTSYTLLDCRFPYEFKGGHIGGAQNIWTVEQLKDLLFTEPLLHPQGDTRDIFVFHCEFSSKRGPKMIRFLRENDRRRNGMNFPKLYYPEIYLLEGGYKAFFEKYSELCSPMGYCPMADEAHTEELRTCKLRSKSWNEDSSRTRRRPSKRHRHSTHESKSSK